MKQLEALGLTDNEIQAYIALLKTGESKVTELSKKADLTRTSLYEILNKLLKKGLVHMKNKSGIQIYSATEPKTLNAIMKEKMQSINSIIPKLEKVYKQPSKNFVEYYEGKRGILAITQDMLNEKKPILVYGNHKLSAKKMQHIPFIVGKRRVEQNMKAKIIIEPTTNSFYKEEEYAKLTQIRFNKDLESVSTMTIIYGDKVAMFSQKGEIIGMLLKNKENAQTQRLIFKTLWKQSKKTC